PRTLKLMPISETIVMAITIIATLATHNLAIGVVLGVVAAMIFFARRVAHIVSIEKVSELDTNHDGEIDTRTYRLHGQLFWASSNDLVYQFDYTDSADHIVIDLTEAEIWDASTVATFDAIIQKFQDKGKVVSIIGLDGPSQERLNRLSGRLSAGHCHPPCSICVAYVSGFILAGCILSLIKSMTDKAQPQKKIESNQYESE